MDSMKNQYDCVVVGGGPAGATTAALVAEKGIQTLLVEREKMPRFHVGESLMPETYWSLERLGVLDKLHNGMFTKKNGVQFVNHEGKESQPFFFRDADDRECADTLHVQRGEFDKVLFDNASEKGATCFDQTRVLNITLNDSGLHQVTLRDREGHEVTVETKMVVDASGQQAMISSNMKTKEVDPHLKKAAIWTYFKDARRNSSPEPEVTAILHTNSKKCWFWYIPLSDDTVSVGVVSDNDYLLKGRGTPEQTFHDEWQQCVGIKNRLQDAKQVGKFNVAKEFSYKSRQVAGEGCVLVGDAYGFIDPSYSSGVFLALKSGEMAADAIIEGFENGDLSGDQLGSWREPFEAGVVWIRKLVDAFYTPEFSFGEFMKAYPQHRTNLTDLLVGKVFEGEPGRMFTDMDPWIASLSENSDETMSASVSS
ncbi:MAG: NAD(P)/FAD-dependent oxidoreductase [Planctomycetota bacterium]|nr:NAD(P)/FAD-dependent oxidoreductase [Planctomycetota bacterium]